MQHTTFLALQSREALVGLGRRRRGLTLTCKPDRLSSCSWMLSQVTGASFVKRRKMLRGGQLTAPVI